MKKIAQLATVVALGLGMACFSYPTAGHAASYESMKEHLLNGTGTLYNGRLQRNLTQAEGEAYVAIMDRLIAEN